MEIINRQISLEPYVTRFPVCFPSLENGFVYYITPENGEIRYTCNYGREPLGINEKFLSASTNGAISSYSAFTIEMNEAYSGEVLSYSVLQRWFTEMVRYRKSLYSDVCHGKFESMVDYYNRMFPDEYSTTNPSQEALDEDNKYILHGGDNFYRWLIDNYFVMLDLEESFDNVDDVFTYEEWFDVIMNVGTSKLTYPAVLKLLGKMENWHRLYSGDTVCADVDNCCDCVDYKLMGGDTMYELLLSWLEVINVNIIKNNNAIRSFNNISDLLPRIDVSVPLKSKIEDFGVFVPIAQEFVPGGEYSGGNVCIYDNDVWIRRDDATSGTTSWVDSDWERYADYYYYDSNKHYEYDKHSQEQTNISEIPDVTGRTMSSLDLFLMQEQTVDGLGNVLPGYFRPNSASTVVQPAENEILDLLYKPGTYANASIVGDNNVVSANTYNGDVLYSISLYAKDWNGNVITGDVQTSIPILVSIGDNVNNKILDCKQAIERWNNVEGNTPTDGKIYADFTYYMGCTFSIDDDTSNTDVVNDNTYVKCVDHCLIEEETCQYYMSGGESYPVRYYNVIRDVEKRYSESLDSDVDVCMCDLFFSASAFTGVQEVVTPIMRREELLDFSRVEKPVDNIYIDRGYATVLDRHLRIGEVRNYEQLEKYGNGIFEIYNADEGLL